MNSRIIHLLLNDLHLQSLTFRRALRSALVVFITVLLYRHSNLLQGYWVTLTAFIVVQTTVGATLRKSLQRLTGTLLGVGIALFLLLFVHNIYIVHSLVIILLFVTYFFNPFSNLINYGFVIIPLSIMVVLMIALITPQKVSLSIIYARFYDTAIGAFIGILGSFFLLPNKVKHEFNAGKENFQKQMADYFVAIMNMFLNISGATKQAHAKKRLVEEALLAHRQFYLERSYEIHFRKMPREENKQFLRLSEKMAQHLFSLHHLARYPLAIDLLQMQQETLEKLRNALYALFVNASTGSDAYELLTKLQKQLVLYAKSQDNPATNWKYLASLSNVNFIIRDLIQDGKTFQSLIAN